MGRRNKDNDSTHSSTLTASSAPSTHSRSSRRSKSGGTSALKAVSITERELRILSRAAAAEFKVKGFDKFVSKTRLGPFVILILGLIFFGIGAASLYLSYTRAGLPLWIFISMCAILGVFFICNVPMWLLLTQWRGAPPANAQYSPEDLPTVDVVITCYKEDISEILDTVVAAQRVEYPPGKLHVYLLDDGRRPELRTVAEELASAGVLRHPFTYVNRDNNEGRKGGNINHWIRHPEFQRGKGEFFVMLDADHQPFPDMMDILFGRYFSLDPLTRARCAYIQAPQFFRNYNRWTDFFDVNLFFLLRVVNPAMDTQGCVIYVGSCALWRRTAIESVGGFYEGLATEDSITGCRVHRTRVPFTDVNWISKYVMQPIAAGLSPQTLPALLDQRLRWYHGLVQMWVHHNFYWFAKELTFWQRLLYVATCGNWVTGIMNFTSMVAVSVLGPVAIALAAHDGRLSLLSGASGWVFYMAVGCFFGSLFIWYLVPGTNLMQKIRGTQMICLYVPTFIAAVIKGMGFNIRVQMTAAEDDGIGRRFWHKLLVVNIVAVVLVFTACGVALWQMFSQPAQVSLAPVVYIMSLIILWVLLHWPHLMALAGYYAAEETFYTDEERGELSDPEIRARAGLKDARFSFATIKMDDDASEDARSHSSKRGDRPSVEVKEPDYAAVTIGKLMYQHRRRWALSSARDEVEGDPTPQSMWRNLSGKRSKKPALVEMAEHDSDGSSGSSSNAPVNRPGQPPRGPPPPPAADLRYTPGAQNMRMP
jgi:cellulose synthase/poly-beta-1,6-N-acetylglucosamine synthase-like glycosyltransferase